MAAPTASLSPEAAAAVADARARWLSYGVQVLGAPDGRTLVVLGETHLKLPAAQRVGRRLVEAFALRGVETFPRRRVLLGRTLGVLIEAPRLAVRLLSLGLIRGSTITDARRAAPGATFLLEEAAPVPLALHVASIYLSAFFTVSFALVVLTPVWGHLPPALAQALLDAAELFRDHLLLLPLALVLRRRPWSWLVYPPVAILTARDQTMVTGTLAMLRAHPEPPAVLVIMGRAHVRGYTRALVAEHGFVRLDEPGS